MAALKKIKSVKNATLFHNANGEPVIRLDNVRLSFPFVGTPADDKDDNGNVSTKWRLVAMLPKDTHEDAHALIEAEINKLIKANDAKVPKDKWFMADGDMNEREEMNGHWLVTASDGKIRPTARNSRGFVIDDIAEIDETFYGGSWAHVLIRPWFFSGKSKSSTKPYPKRVSAGLSAVVFSKNDKPFGNARIDDEDAWDGVQAADDDGDDGL